MVEKRFTRDNTGCVLDNTRIVKAINVEQVVDLLNNLHEENTKLKSENNMLRNTIGRNEAYIERLTHKGEWRL